MLVKSMEDKSISLLRLAEERALSKRAEKEEKKRQREKLIPYLPKDCISNILVRLPLDSLQRSRFVCKPWYKIVNSPVFIDALLHCSETVLIFLSATPREMLYHFSAKPIPQEKPNTFSVEAKLFQLQSVHVFQQPLIDPTLKFYIKFMEIKDGKYKIGEFHATCLGKIRAACNGLILLDNKMKKGGLIVMNPVTRQLTALPVGTLCPPQDESFGLAFCNCTSKYKLVHLFRDEMQYIGCEILELQRKSWKMVDGPPFGLFGWFGYDPVFAIGALHWIPHIDHSEYIVSMAMDQEKFHEIPLPKSSRTQDRIVEMGGLLCFVTHQEMNQIDIWILRNLCREGWTKQYTVLVGCVKDMVPLYCSRPNVEIIFKDKDGSFYAYDLELQVMTRVEMEKGCFPVHGCYLPHVNSLVSWRIKDADD